MILCTDTLGNTGIYSEDRALRMASQWQGEKVTDISRALEILNTNPCGDVWQLDAEYIEGISNDQSV